MIFIPPNTDHDEKTDAEARASVALVGLVHLLAKQTAHHLQAGDLSLTDPETAIPTSGR